MSHSRYLMLVGHLSVWNVSCIEWAMHVGLPVVLDLGMTEVGGMIHPIARYQYSTGCLTLSSEPLFHSDNTGNSTQG